MDKIQKQIRDLREHYHKGYRCESLYEDMKELHDDFEDEFIKYAKNEILHADIEVYGDYIMAAIRDINEIYTDAFKRYKVKLYLEEYFFDKFPKYKFLERYDLSNYKSIYYEINFIEKMRIEILNFIYLIDDNKKVR